MSENFSTTADLYRLSGELDAEDDTYPATDGRGKSASECRARLARMFGRDARDAPDERWDFLARHLRERHLQMLGEAVAQVFSRGITAGTAPFIAAGAGHFLVPELARRFGRTCETYASLVPTAEETMRRRAGVCAPAVAVALLAAAEG